MNACWHLCCGTDWIYANAFRSNVCVFKNPDGYASTCDSKIAPNTWDVGNNRLFTKSGDLNVCNMTLHQWVAGGHDVGTTVSAWPTDADLIAWSRELLGM